MRRHRAHYDVSIMVYSFFQLGRWDEAEAHYTRAQSLNPQSDFAWEMYAKALEEDGRLERAVWAWSMVGPWTLGMLWLFRKHEKRFEFSIIL